MKPLKPLPECIEARLAALRFEENLLGFCLSRMQSPNVSLNTDNLLGHPALRILAAKQDMEQWINRSQLGEEKQGHHDRAANRQAEPDLVAPRKLHQANEVFHK